MRIAPPGQFFYCHPPPSTAHSITSPFLLPPGGVAIKILTKKTNCSLVDDVHDLGKCGKWRREQSKRDNARERKRSGRDLALLIFTFLDKMSMIVNIFSVILVSLVLVILIVM